MKREVTIDGIKKIRLSYDHDPESHTTKRGIALSLDVEEAEASELKSMMVGTSVWSVKLTAIAQQIPLKENLTSEGNTADVREFANVS